MALSQKSVKLIMRRKMTRRMMKNKKVRARLVKMKMNLQTRMISRMMNLRMAVHLISTMRSDTLKRILTPRPSS